MSTSENALVSARALLFGDPSSWSDLLGPFVFNGTILDLGTTDRPASGN